MQRLRDHCDRYISHMWSARNSTTCAVALNNFFILWTRKKEPNSLKGLFYVLIICTSVPVSESVYMWMHVRADSRRKHWVSWSCGHIGLWATQWECWEANSGPLQGQNMSFTPKPPLPLPSGFYIWDYIVGFLLVEDIGSIATVVFKVHFLLLEFLLFLVPASL